MTTHVPYADRGNILAYIDNVRAAARKDVKEKIQRARARYLQNSGGKAYNKQNLEILEATSRPLQIIVSKQRYDDLFEDFMKYFDADKINTTKELKEQLEGVFDKSARFDDFRRKKPTGYKQMINNLSRSFLATGKVQEFLDEKTVEQLTTARSAAFTEKINDKQRAKWSRLVGEKKAYKIYNKKKRQAQFIYQDDKSRYRDINTGRFATSPGKLRKELMSEY